ncbi:MAG: hypothetical protein J5767_05205, partial [Paludibacteraceae bacterium]|nr:hypothetical protein [Paludibacteraceae bacterium]
LKDLSSLSLPPPAVVLPLESECKGIAFFIPHQKFSQLFFEVFYNALIRSEKNLSEHYHPTITYMDMLPLIIDSNIYCLLYYTSFQ